SILVEMGFMSNPEEDRLLNDPEYQMKLVDGMVKGIADYMGRELNEE
ncbi:MAG: N-acetylmuramoyl-L-alanine amidase, partial [Clostridia bacterium]|nr:N-acetylmuramoyl-L-alanine amidase [Clostridia bacterium]